MQNVYRLGKVIITLLALMAAFVFVTNAGTEGRSHLAQALSGLLINGLMLAWIVSAVAHRRRRSGEAAERLPARTRFSTWLAVNEAMVALCYRIAVVLLLALLVDKMDRFTWDIAQAQANSAEQAAKSTATIERSVSTIEDTVSEIQKYVIRLQR